MGPRIDLYSLPHKSLRHALHEAGAMLGAAATAPAAEALALLAAHGRHEDEFIAPLLAAHLPRLAASIRREHDELERQIELVHAALTGDDPVTAYRAYHRVVAANLAHLDEEETVVLPALWAVVPDTALTEVFAAFRAAHPEADDLFVRWPAPLTAEERRLVGAG